MWTSVVGSLARAGGIGDDRVAERKHHFTVKHRF